MQTTILRAFRAAERQAFGKTGRPRFEKAEGLNVVKYRGDAELRFRVDPMPAVHWRGLTLPLKLDPKDAPGWQPDALGRRTKFVRRTVRGRVRCEAQLVQDGLPPQVRANGQGTVARDVGPSTIAIVSDGDATLRRFCAEVDEPHAEAWWLSRTLDRARRATNPDALHGDGTRKRGAAIAVRSKRYPRTRTTLADTERRLAAARKTARGRLAN